jgi:hypothetical protein
MHFFNHTQPLVLNSVVAAEQKIVNGGMNKEYAGISGAMCITSVTAIHHIS